MQQSPIRPRGRRRRRPLHGRLARSGCAGRPRPSSPLGAHSVGPCARSSGGAPLTSSSSA
eukprot:1394598-Lingulodinium_polyedra.AAC.1